MSGVFGPPGVSRGEASVTLLFGLGLLIQGVIAHVVTHTVQQVGQVRLRPGQRYLWRHISISVRIMKVVEVTRTTLFLPPGLYRGRRFCSPPPKKKTDLLTCAPQDLIKRNGHWRLDRSRCSAASAPADPLLERGRVRGQEERMGAAPGGGAVVNSSQVQGKQRSVLSTLE